MKFYATLYFNGATTSVFNCSDTLEFTFTANSFEEAIKSYSSYDKSFCIKIDGGYKVINTSSVKYIDIIDEQTYLKQQEVIKSLTGEKSESPDTDRVAEQEFNIAATCEALHDITHNQNSTDIDQSVTSKCGDVSEENPTTVKKRKYTRKDASLETPATESKVYVNNDVE